MASLNTEILIRPEYRPCIVSGRKCLFHQWMTKTKFVKRDERVSYFLVGIVEREDGTMHECLLREIVFIDELIKEYAFKGDND